MFRVGKKGMPNPQVSVVTKSRYVYVAMHKPKVTRIMVKAGQLNQEQVDALAGAYRAIA